MTTTSTPITRSYYAATVALRDSYMVRDSKRDDSAAIVARNVAGNTCPRCAREFTATNGAEFCHWITTKARVSSCGAWFGSVACRRCNMVDENIRAILNLDSNEPLPFEYVSEFFTIPAEFNSRGEIIAMANEIACDIPKANDIDVIDDSMAIASRLGYV